MSRKNYLSIINQDDNGLNILIKKGYNLLQLETFFTSGPEESRAWTVNKNSQAPAAAGKIQSDFENSRMYRPASFSSRARTCSKRTKINVRDYLKIYIKQLFFMVRLQMKIF